MSLLETYILDTEILNDERLFYLLFANMPVYRQEKIRNYIFKKDRLLSLGAGVLLAHGLKYRGLDEHKCLQLGDKGKPYLSDNLFYNISHSGSKVVCSFSDEEVGVDIEQIVSINDALIRHACVPAEQLYLLELEPQAQRQKFFELWTAKESYMKLLGTGLALPPTQLELIFRNTLLIRHSGKPVNVHFKQYPLEGYCLTVCSKKADFASSITGLSNPGELKTIFS